MPVILPKAAAITLWSCLGLPALLMCQPRTDEAWHVALAILCGQFAIAALLSAGHPRRA